jgi:hypothetical protein
MRKTSVVLFAAVLGLAGCKTYTRPLTPPSDEPAVELRSEPAETASAQATGEFAFPSDRGGRLLAELLPPSEKARPQPLALPSRQRPHSSLAGGQEPAPPLPANQANPARLHVKQATRVLRPISPPEDYLLAGQRGERVLPQAIVLPAGERVRLASTPVEEPPALPILAQPVADRASLDDPTVEASQASALSAPPPERSTPAPAIRQAVADPFANRETAPRLPPDDPTPVTATPKPPRS